MTDDIQSLLADVKVLAVRAVEQEKENQFQFAAFCYEETARLIDIVLGLGADQPGLRERAEEYRDRSKTLSSLISSNTTPEHVAHEPGSGELARAYNLLAEALELDEAGEAEDALEQYKLAVEVCLETKKNVESKSVQEKLSRVAVQALERAEKLRADLENVSVTEVSVRSITRPLGELNWRSEPGTGAKSGYSEEEIKVLKVTSTVNGREYLPFIQSDLIREKFAFPVAWSDPGGKLSLSPKQRQRLRSWCRPDEFIPSPKMIVLVSELSVKQTVVSDCSFVASIAIAAQYEKRYNKKLVTSIIYPQNKAGDPVYNPCGKYMVKLHINGVLRKVIIDDFFPVGSHNEPLCSYSSNKSELWISLVGRS